MVETGNKPMKWIATLLMIFLASPVWAADGDPVIEGHEPSALTKDAEWDTEGEVETIWGINIFTDADVNAIDISSHTNLAVDANELTLTGDSIGLANHDTARSAIGLAIGVNVQAYDADLTTFAGITPSANVVSLLNAADYAAMRTLLDLEAGIDFYSISAADAAFQPLEATLTDIADGTINENLVNTAYPWADDEVSDTLTSSVCTGNAATVTNATFTTALTVNTGTVTLTGDVANTSALTIGAGASSISGTNTGDNTVATSGDSAVDFFGAGVSAVTDATECTDIEGTNLSIAGGVLNATDTNTQLSGEEVDDFVNALIKDADSVHTRITITYDDVNNAFDFVVDDMNDDVPEAGDFGAATDLDANGAIVADAVALTTDTTGNYAAGDGEAGNALTGDSATAFFDAGTIEHERGGLEADVNAYSGLAKITGGATTELKINWSSAVAPDAATDDVTLGYIVGSRWLDTTADKEYVCLDNTDGAAVWTETTGAGDVTAAANIIDNRLVRGDGGGKGIQDSGVWMDDSNNINGFATLYSENIYAKDTYPIIGIWNTTHEDLNGGRAGRLYFKGEQSGGEDTYLAEIRAEHEGDSDDQKGRLRIYINDGDDGGSPTEAVDIHSDGIVDFPEQSYCYVYMDADQTVSNTTTETLEFDVEVPGGDVRSEFNTATYTFTAIRAGKYTISLAGMWVAPNDTSNYTLRIYVNGAYEVGIQDYYLSGSYACQVMPATIILDANDAVTARCYQNSGGDETMYGGNVRNSTYMTIAKVH